MARKRKPKSFWDLIEPERGEDLSRFDKPLDPKEFRPLTRAERAWFRRMQRGPTVSVYVYGRTTRMIKVRLNSEVVKRFDKVADRLRMSRDHLIERGMVALMQIIR